MMAGVVMYTLASIQGSFQALRDANMFTHFSQWPVGHAHLALLGGFGFLAVGAVYYIVPRVLKFKIFSDNILHLSKYDILSICCCKIINRKFTLIICIFSK